MARSFPTTLNQAGNLLPKRLRGNIGAFGNGSTLPRFKKGGKVKKTGPAIVHKGERVLNAKQTKSFDRKFKAVNDRVKKKMSAQ